MKEKTRENYKGRRFKNRKSTSKLTRNYAETKIYKHNKKQCSRENLSLTTDRANG